MWGNPPWVRIPLPPRTTDAQLDLDHIARLDEYDLDQLAEDQAMVCIGYGPYVLIGELRPGASTPSRAPTGRGGGTMTMKAPGRRVERGQGQDQTYFKEAFRKVSKKSITVD